MKQSHHPEAAQAFLSFLRSEAATAVFEGIGFTAIQTE
jgi:ABC-type molybdate transport system substrate-binding protein